jgi:hypothetical protein
MTHRFRTLLSFTITAATLASAQELSERTPRFEDYPAKGRFHGNPSPPMFNSPVEKGFQSVISDGVRRGWGVFDGTTGKEMGRAGPNFAGHYIIVNFGCGEFFSDCLGSAIVDARTGHVYRFPIPDAGMHWKPYFGVLAAERVASNPPDSFHGFPLKSPLAYRLNSRLLVANTCEGVEPAGGSVITFNSVGCGAHYYIMDEDGLKLIHRSVE